MIFKDAGWSSNNSSYHCMNHDQISKEKHEFTVYSLDLSFNSLMNRYCKERYRRARRVPIGRTLKDGTVSTQANAPPRGTWVHCPRSPQCLLRTCRSSPTRTSRPGRHNSSPTQKWYQLYQTCMSLSSTRQRNLFQLQSKCTRRRDIWIKLQL